MDEASAREVTFQTRPILRFAPKYEPTPNHNQVARWDKTTVSTRWHCVETHLFDLRRCGSGE
jgi:hypothetical protein